MMRICSSALSPGQITCGGGDASFSAVPSHCLLMVPVLRPRRGPRDWEASDIAHSSGSAAAR